MRRIPTRSLLIALTLLAVPLAAYAQESFADRARAAGAATTNAAPADAAGAPEAQAQPMDSGTAPADGAAPAGDASAPGAPVDKLAAAKAQASATAATLDTYTIQRGDTLWDICARMLGDPFFWPKLWTFNQYITNPHWIYPGNVLSFREGTETTPPQFEVTKPDAVPVAAAPTPDAAVPTEKTEVAAAVTPVPAAPVPVQPENLQEGFQAAPESVAMAQPVETADKIAFASPISNQQAFEVNLRQEGFIAESQIPPLGVVYKSEDPRENLAEFDQAYVRIPNAAVGQKFTVYRTLHRVKHPKTRGYVGFLVKILAQLEIIEVNGDVATAKIVTSYDSIRRGDPITEYVSVLKQVNLAPNGAQIDGTIIETMVDGITIMGSGDVIYLDKGQSDGLKIGNTLDVVRRNDGLEKVQYGYSDKSLPQQVVARLVVVGTRDKTATAVIMNANDAILVGDLVRMAPN